jgi:hypothetical protein
MKKIRRCNMNMPGFTAEASLYKTSEHYKAVGTPDVLAGGVEIVPQQFCTDLRQDFWGEWFNTPTGEPLISLRFRRCLSPLLYNLEYTFHLEVCPQFPGGNCTIIPLQRRV